MTNEQLIIELLEQLQPPKLPINIDLSTDQTFDPPLRAISIGEAGNIKVDTPDDKGVLLLEECFAVGVQHIAVIEKIYSSANGTTANKILGWR